MVQLIFCLAFPTKEIFFDIKLFNTLRQHSPGFVVYTWSCWERELREGHSKERVQDPS